MPSTRINPDRLVLSLDGTNPERVQLASTTDPIRGLRIDNRTTGTIYFHPFRPVLAAGDAMWSVGADKIAAADVGQGTWTIDFLAAVAGEADIEITPSPGELQGPAPDVVVSGTVDISGDVPVLPASAQELPLWGRLTLYHQLLLSDTLTTVTTERSSSIFDVSRFNSVYLFTKPLARTRITFEWYTTAAGTTVAGDEELHLTSDGLQIVLPNIGPFMRIKDISTASGFSLPIVLMATNHSGLWVPNANSLFTFSSTVGSGTSLTTSFASGIYGDVDVAVTQNTSTAWELEYELATYDDLTLSRGGIFHSAGGTNETRSVTRRIHVPGFKLRLIYNNRSGGNQTVNGLVVPKSAP